MILPDGITDPASVHAAARAPHFPCDAYRDGTTDLCGAAATWLGHFVSDCPHADDPLLVCDHHRRVAHGGIVAGGFRCHVHEPRHAVTWAEWVRL